MCSVNSYKPCDPVHQPAAVRSLSLQRSVNESIAFPYRCAQKLQDELPSYSSGILNAREKNYAYSSSLMNTPMVQLFMQ